jgi:hypothetical protein
MVFREFVKHTFQFLVDAGLQVLTSVGAWTFRTMIWHQRPLISMYDILSLTNSTLLTADMILLCTRNLYLIHDSYSPFRRKMCILQQVRCHHPLIWLLSLPLNVTYISTVPLKLSLGSPPYTNSLHSIIQISCPYSIALVFYPGNAFRSETLSWLS